MTEPTLITTTKSRLPLKIFSLAGSHSFSTVLSDDSPTRSIDEAAARPLAPCSEVRTREWAIEGVEPHTDRVSIKSMDTSLGNARRRELA